MSNLTPEQLAKRRKTNKKIVKFGCLPILALLIIIIVIGVITDSNDKNKKNNDVANVKSFNIDSLVNAIKNTDIWEVKDVYWNPKDSIINVAITNKYNAIKNKEYSTYAFENDFHLDSVNEINGENIYEYVPGKSLAKGDYESTEPLAFDNTTFDAIANNIKDNYMSYFKKGNSREINDAIKQELNDPASYEEVSTKIDSYNFDTTFNCSVVFRAKNAFNATITQTATCEIDQYGNVTNLKIGSE